MSFKSNVLASFASQLYVTAAGIIMVPLYIQYMGIETYGLVGFFFMLQVWFNLLDLGMTPTIARESARFCGGAINALDYRHLTRALEGVFLSVALLGGGVLIAGAGWVARHWLNASQLPLHEIIAALQLMAVIIALRWMSGLYRGIISGSERLLWLSGFSTLIATARFVLILPVLMFVSASPFSFFIFQLVVVVLELAGLAYMAYRLLPALPDKERIRWQWAPLKPVLKFSLSIAFALSAWVLVTQIDKLLLSQILSLADYGYFTVAALAASGIMTISVPVSNSLMPRMTRLQAEGKHEQLLVVYRQATQLVTVLALPLALLLVFFSRQVLWVWTGDSVLANKVSSTLALYALGYAFLVVGAFPYYLQYAKGSLRFHLIGSSLFVLLLIPSVIWTATHHGMQGAGWAWMLANAAYFFFWTPLIHHQFAPGMHWDWLIADIARPALLPILGAALVAQFFPWSNLRWVQMLELFGVGAVLLALACVLARRINILGRL